LNAALREKRHVKGEINEKEDFLQDTTRLVNHCHGIFFLTILTLYRELQPLAHRKTFTWENLNYHVPSPSGPLRLLHDVQGYVKPGTLTALMGASGAGMLFFPPADVVF